MESINETEQLNDVENNNHNVSQIMKNKHLNRKTDVMTSSPWPSPLVENFDDPDWPDLSQLSSSLSDNNDSSKESHSTNSIENWLLENKQLLVRAVTWNLCAKSPPAVKKITERLIPQNKFHVYIIGSEECERSIAKSALNPSKRTWEAYLIEAVGANYVPVRSHTLQAIHIMVFVHKSISHLCSLVTSAAVPTGVGSTLGNKGGVGVYLKILSTRLLVVNAHLAAHQRAEKRRNAEFQRINVLMPLLLEKKDAVLVPRIDEGVAKSQFSNIAAQKQILENEKSELNSPTDPISGALAENNNNDSSACSPLSPTSTTHAGGIAFSPVQDSKPLDTVEAVPDEESGKKLPPTSPSEVIDSQAPPDSLQNENTLRDQRSSVGSPSNEASFPSAATLAPTSDKAKAKFNSKIESPISPSTSEVNLQVSKQLSGLDIRGAEEDWPVAESDYDTDNGGYTDSPRSNISHHSHYSHMDPLADLDPSVRGSKKTLDQCAELVIFMGDLNYRINGNRSIISKLLDNDMHEVLLSNDQLRSNMKQQLVLNKFAEAPLNFKPTYKYDVGTNVYDSSPKNRIPSWTDRILYVPNSKLRCLAYNADDSLTTSDHRPVYASFALKLEDYVQVDEANNVVLDKVAPQFTSESQVCSIM